MSIRLSKSHHRNKNKFSVLSKIFVQTFPIDDFVLIHDFSFFPINVFVLIHDFSFFLMRITFLFTMALPSHKFRLLLSQLDHNIIFNFLFATFVVITNSPYCAHFGNKSVCLCTLINYTINCWKRNYLIYCFKFW